MTFWPFEQVDCFSVPYCRSFVAPRCSAAYCFYVLCSFILVFAPLFASFASDNFWVKEGSYREQPLLQFQHELFISLAGDSPSDTVGWTNRPELEPLRPADVRVPTIRSTPYDTNHDGVPDTWKLVVRVPTGNVSKGYRHLRLLAVYSVELREKVLATFSGMVSLDLASPFPATGVWLRGQAQLKQRLPLRVEYDVRNIYAESPLAVRPTSSWAAQHAPLRLRDLLDRYATRNETLQMDLLVPPVWDYTPQESFQFEMVLDVPPLLVQYVPPALEVLKLGWIQFLSLLIPTWVALQALKAFAFDQQIVESFVVPHLPPKARS